MKITKNLAEGNIYKNLILYTVPLILSALLSQAYSTVDGVIAGKCIGEFALGAVGATASFETLIGAVFGGFAAGFSIYLSHLFGKGDFAAVKRDTVGMITFVVLGSAAISALSIGFHAPIMRYLKVDPLLWEDARRYFIIYTAGYAVFYANSLLVYALNALGITSFSFFVSLISAVLNIGGNLLTVLVFDMGVAGLAVSTLLSAIVATVCYVVVLRRAFAEMACGRVSYRFSFACVGRSLRYSVPTAIQQLSFHGVSFLIAPAVNGLGAVAMTANNVATRIYAFGTQGLWASASAFACFSGQCVGLGDAKKLRHGVRAGFVVVCLATLPLVLIFSVFASPIVSLFFPAEHGGEAFGYAVRYAVVYLPLTYVQLIGHFLHSYLRSLGRITTVLVISVTGSIARWAATLWLVPVMHLEGAFLAQVLAWGVDAVICVVLFLLFYQKEAHLRRIIEKIHQKT